MIENFLHSIHNRHLPRNAEVPVEDGTILYPILALAFVVLVGVVLWVFVRRIEGVLASGRRVIARQKECRLVRKGFWGSAIGSICIVVPEI